MNDREILEMAAKAAFPDRWIWNDIYDKIETMTPCGLFFIWDPQHDDDDCARMENEIGINLHFGKYAVFSYYADDIGTCEKYADHDGNKQAARRMASLRVAATIGKAIP